MEVHPYYFSLSKRFFDLSVSGVLLILFLPLFFVISFIILITVGWPIFYSQKRYGLDKKEFHLTKFRIMYVGAEKNQWRYRDNNIAPLPFYKNWQDPRFVGIGRFLSRTGLDELPQLINIFKGEMSLIGPRPLPIYEAEKLKPTWDFRYQVKPGIFSQWSLSNQRHASLGKWKCLEKDTLKQGGWKYDILTIINTIKQTWS